MYKLDSINIGKQIKYYRKTRGFTLDALANKIHKTKATISKYEKNIIVPDIITIIEICNSFKIHLSELIPFAYESFNYFRNNPFKVNKLYLYYLTDKKIITSILEIIDNNSEEIKVRFYNGIKDSRTYASNCCYTYYGTLESKQNIAYINLRNSLSSEIFLEKPQILVNIPWTNNSNFYNFLINGITPNGKPIIKKGVLSTFELNDLKIFENDFKISKEELKEIKNNNAWILESKNYEHFFYDLQN